MGRRRKRRKKIVRRRRLPGRYFQCPRCGSMTLTIDFKKSDKPGYKVAVARCGTCGLYCEIEVPALLERIDVYNKIADLVYEDRLDECTPAAPPGEEELEPVEAVEEAGGSEGDEGPGEAPGGEEEW